MAILYITEGRLGASGSLGPMEFMGMPKVASQTVAIGAVSTQSAAFNARTQLVRLEADAACLVEIGGGNPTATATSARIAANAPGEYFVVNPGELLAVIVSP